MSNDLAMIEQLEELDLRETKSSVVTSMFEDDAGNDVAEVLEALPRLLALARRGLELEEQLERGRLHQEIEGQLGWEESRQEQNQCDQVLGVRCGQARR